MEEEKVASKIKNCDYSLFSIIVPIHICWPIFQRKKVKRKRSYHNFILRLHVV